MVVYTIECDEIGFSTQVQAETHAVMVRALVEKGMRRISKHKYPFRGEILAYTDALGRVWDAMPDIIHHAVDLPQIDALSSAAACLNEED